MEFNGKTVVGAINFVVNCIRVIALFLFPDHGHSRLFPFGPIHSTAPLSMDIFGSNGFAEIPIRFNSEFIVKGREYDSILVREGN